MSSFCRWKKFRRRHTNRKKVNVRNGKPIFYEPEELKNARAKFESLLARHVPPDKLKGPVRLTVKWCFPMIKGVRTGQYKTTAPDTDNLQKLFKDCMSEVGFWKNDAQVASEIAEKFWSEVVGIYVRVEEWDDELYTFL